MTRNETALQQFAGGPMTRAGLIALSIIILDVLVLLITGVN